MLLLLLLQRLVLRCDASIVQLSSERIIIIIISASSVVRRQTDKMEWRSSPGFVLALLCILTALVGNVDPRRHRSGNYITAIIIIQAGRRQVRSLLPVCHIDVFMFKLNLA